MNPDESYNNRIVVQSDVHFGKPCIAGTRITVQDVLELLENGITFDEMIEKYYPDINIEDIKACIHYAAEIIRSEEIHLEKAV
ncbi:MAG: DUF433 domain-containing protein [Candidatus Omnitrophica bacterium]|nr:DUF433 domain-containing protein [Candidatus Omnitrophota bacterium]